MTARVKMTQHSTRNFGWNPEGDHCADSLPPSGPYGGNMNLLLNPMLVRHGQRETRPYERDVDGNDNEDDESMKTKDARICIGALHRNTNEHLIVDNDDDEDENNEDHDDDDDDDNDDD